MGEHKKLGEILVQLKVLNPIDVERVLDCVGRRHRRPKFGQMARDMGLVTEEEILAALAVQMELFPGVNRLNLRQILNYLHTVPATAG
jgi:hypothetical protein